MPYNRPLKFTVANRRDFSAFVYGLFVIAIISAVLSPHPLPLVFLTTLLFGVGWFRVTLGFSELGEVKLISVIFPTGRLTIESNAEHIIEGFLCGQQWCTHHAAVLRYKTEEGIKRVVILSRQQSVDDYRRLKVCLQQNFCNDANKRPAGLLFFIKK